MRPGRGRRVHLGMRQQSDRQCRRQAWMGSPSRRYWGKAMPWPLNVRLDANHIFGGGSSVPAYDPSPVSGTPGPPPRRVFVFLGLRSLRLFRITRLQSAEQTPKSRFAQGSLDLASRDPAFKPFVNHAPATSLSMGRPRYGRWTHDRDMDELRRGCG